MDNAFLRRLVIRKRDGGRLTEEWPAIVRAHVAGRIDEALLAALLMACLLNGMDFSETLALTVALVASGETLALPFPISCDKHSTGGVADLGSLLVVPIVAACGVPVAKLSGRALGHTGGTIDKLEAVPGVRTDLSTEAFVAAIRAVGCAIASQTGSLVPGDRAMYALRDRTATVPSAGLIAASVVSKKIAGGASAIVYDVKCGDAAFMRTLPEAEALARLLTALTRELGRTSRALVTDMSEPLGRAIGTGIEIAEARDFLGGVSHDARVHRVALALAATSLDVAGMEGGLARAEAALASGAAADRFARMLTAQGAHTGALAALAPHPEQTSVRADRDGIVQCIDATTLGDLARDVVAACGSTAGLRVCVRRGDVVRRGDTLIDVYADRDRAHAVVQRLRAAFTLTGEPFAPADPVLTRVD